jgi:hypothetical protein
LIGKNKDEIQGHCAQGQDDDLKGSEYTYPRFVLENVVFFFFGAHGKKCRSDDHSEKYQCENKIVNHWGSLLFGAALNRL